MPARLPNTKRPRISNDVLITILENMDPVSLYRTCQAFSRVYYLVMQVQSLLYKFELASLGLKDGPLSHRARPPFQRLQVLLKFKENWPKLAWSEEQKVSIPPNHNFGVSGGFLYHSGTQSIDLAELPSWRIETPDGHDKTRHLKFNGTSQADCIAVDALQHLIVVVQTVGGPNGHIELRLKFRNLWKYDKHSRAAAASYSCLNHVNQPVESTTAQISGNHLAVTIKFAGGLTKHLLLDWCTHASMWIDEQDIIILDSTRMLGVGKLHGKLAIHLYNISDMRRISIMREYDLPPVWTNAVMRFAQNTAPNSRLSSASRAMFYTDPDSRVLTLTAQVPGPNGGAIHWMFIDESFFRFTLNADRQTVPFSYWNQFCLIKELRGTQIIGSPQVVGNRVVYLERDDSRADRGGERLRLGVLNFSRLAEPQPPSSKQWTLIGKYSALRVSEGSREFSHSVTNGLAVKDIRATEDNIILILDKLSSCQPINILTFGEPVSRHPVRHEVQYHPSL
ncbi:hypothetical protein BJ165DRAFT_1531560 [Panaeolus papilionaceus]|nr:hypothetical protein BJ165DRAFT_1531560 [Panaeolus papilionaceus]